MGGLKPSVLAKLVQGAADLYGVVSIAMQSASNKPQFGGEWGLLVQLKSCMYAGVAQWELARAEIAAKHYGSHLGLLRQASVTLTDVDRRKLTKKMVIVESEKKNIQIY